MANITTNTIDLTSNDSTITMTSSGAPMKSYISEVVEVTKDGDAIIDLPEEMLKELGWKEGDVLDMNMVDGKIILKKNVV